MSCLNNQAIINLFKYAISGKCEAKWTSNTNRQKGQRATIISEDDNGYEYDNGGDAQDEENDYNGKDDVDN